MNNYDSLHELADEMPDHSGTISIHTGKVTKIEELVAWSRCLKNIRTNYAGDNSTWLTGDVGSLRVFVNYERGMLGEPTPKYNPVSETAMSEAALVRLKELQRMDDFGIGDEDMVNDISRNPNNN